MRRLRVLLDANVLVDAQVRDLFCSFAEVELIEIRWSAFIIDELRTALTTRLGLEAVKVDSLTDALARAFPNAEVTGFEALASDLELRDADDRHVLAAAAVGECDLLVTFNTKHFPQESATPFDVEIASVDDAIVLVVASHPGSVADVVDHLLARIQRPSMTKEQFIERLTGRAPLGGPVLGAAMGLESWAKVVENIRHANSPDGPIVAVQRLITAVGDGPVDAVAAMVGPELAAELTGSTQPHANDLHTALRARLDDVFTSSGWGYATDQRPHGPDVEFVKLVRAGEEPTLVVSPTLFEGHMFRLRHDGIRWTIVGLDEPDPAFP